MKELSQCDCLVLLTTIIFSELLLSEVLGTLLGETIKRIEKYRLKINVSPFMNF